MSEALYSCYLIKKIDIWSYIIKHKKLIETNILEKKPNIIDLFYSENLIALYEKKGFDRATMVAKLLKHNPGVNAYLDAINENNPNIDKYKIFLKYQYNNFSYIINLSLMNVDLGEYMIIQDGFGVLKNLHLADLSFSTSTDAWVNDFKQTIKKYNLVNSKNKLFTVNKLSKEMLNSVFSKPKINFELYNESRMFNFIDKSIVFQLVKNQLDEFFKDNLYSDWDY